MDEKEIKQFSFMRALNALANPADRAAQAAAGFEREVSEAAAKKSGKSPTGILVPTDVLRSALMTDFGAANQGYNAMARAMATMMRDLTVGTSTAGGHTVSTNLLAGSFIELLRSRMVMARLGATMLNGLTGNIAVPRQTSGATAYWVAESGAPTETQQAFDQVTMTPKTCGAFTDYSRKLLLQSSIDVEAFIRMDLAKVIGLELDRVALYGTGSSNQPRGIDQTAGINTVNFAAAAPTFAEIVNMETQVAADNADVGTLAYLVNATGRGGLKTAEKASSTGQFIWENGNTVNGYRAEVSNQVAAGDFWFGNWADVLMGFWSGLDLTVDPYTGSTSGTVRVVALQDVDVAVRHPESFCNGADNP
jgi:HK97 family phage major capsid protein